MAGRRSRRPGPPLGSSLVPLQDGYCIVGRLHPIDVAAVAVLGDDGMAAHSADLEEACLAVDDDLNSDCGASVPFLAVVGNLERPADLVGCDFPVVRAVVDSHFLASSAGWLRWRLPPRHVR